MSLTQPANTSSFFQSKIDLTFQNLLNERQRTEQKCRQVLIQTSMKYSDCLFQEEQMIVKNQQIIDKKKKKLLLNQQMKLQFERMKKDLYHSLNSNNAQNHNQTQNIQEQKIPEIQRHELRMDAEEVQYPVFSQISAREINKKQQQQEEKQKPERKRKLRSNIVDEDSSQESSETNQYTLKKISYTPNMTPLKFTLFQCEESDQFDQEQVEKLSEYDLKPIQAVMISTKEMDNIAFASFSRLDWNDLKSLKIQSNNITDISPLKQLNYAILKDLDISFNPLKQDSAKILARLQFESLIYFTVSFAQGCDNSCWEILLKNKMANFPQLQRLDVGNSPYLSSKVKKQIELCMHIKSLQQISKWFSLFEEQNPAELISFSSKLQYLRNPKQYKIKIKWLDSDQAYSKYTSEDFHKRQQEWRKQVSCECTTAKQSLEKLEKPQPIIKKTSQNDKIKRKRGRKRKEKSEQKIPVKQKQIQKQLLDYNRNKKWKKTF